MRRRRKGALLGTGIAAALAVAALAGPVQANTTIPGLNGKILFTSTRDFPYQVPPSAPSVRGLDQSCFASTSNFNCAEELYSMNPDGGSVTRLTNNTAGDDEGAWLPADGSQIAFESDRASGAPSCKLLPGGCGTLDIWSMGGDGSAPIQLTTDAGDETHASYSPDGTKIAFAGHNPDIGASPAAKQLPPPSAFTEIFTMPAGGESVGAPTPLLPAGQTGITGPETAVIDNSPSYSPDGTKVAFTRLTIALLSAGAASKVTPTPTLVEFDIRTYIAPAAGGGPATPLETFGVCKYSTLAPVSDVGALVQAFSSGSAGALRSAMQSRGFPPGCSLGFSPAWSPDGSKIAVGRLSSTLAPPPGSASRLGPVATFDPGDIVVVPVADPASEVDLSNVTESPDCSYRDATNPCSQDGAPAWSPDGTKIAFESDRLPDGSGIPAGTSCSDPSTGVPNGTCDFEIWTMNADGTGLTQLTNNNFDDFSPDWQRIAPPPPPPPPAPPVVPATPPKVGVAGVRRACVSSSFHVRFRIATSSAVKSVVVKLDGKRIKSTKSGSFTLRINSKKLRAGRHRLTIIATDTAGHTTTTHKSFSVCKAAKPRRKAAPRFTG